MAGQAGIQNQCVIRANITGDAFTLPDRYTCTRQGEVLDASVVPTAVAGQGTVTVGKGASPISNPIPCAVVGLVGRATSIDPTFHALISGDEIRFTASDAAVRGLVSVTFTPRPAGWFKRIP
jgi:hypothetical protein